MNWNFVDIETTPSTNDEVKACKAYTVLSAKQQTNGRGRLGRSWSSLAGNLFCSFLFPGNLLPPEHLSLLSAVALLKTVQKIAPQADICIKWPNDVLLNGKKLAGILIERFDDKVVVGIGVNLASAPDDVNSLYRATSLKAVGVEIDRLLFLHLLADFFAALLSKKNFADIKQMWQQNAKGINKNVEIRNCNCVKTGKFIGLGEQGEMLIENAGKVEKILAGDVFYKEEKDE